MERRFNQQQEQAINSRNRELLISAAAGSGKTTVLVERILFKLLHEKDLSVDQFLIVTFTHASASDMKDRLYKRLTEYCERYPEQEERFRTQVAMLPRAAIGTLHSFCLNLIREHHTHPAVGLPSSFHLITEEQSKLLLQEALDETLTEAYESPDKACFYRLLNAFSDMNDDEKVRSILKDLYTSARNDPDPRAWLERMAGGSSGEEITRRWYEIARTMMQTTQETAQAALKLPELTKGVRRFYTAVEQLTTEIIRLIDGGDYANAQLLINQANKRVGSVPRQEAGEDTQVLILRKQTKSIKEKCFKNLMLQTIPGEQQEDHGNIQTLCRLALRLDELFAQKKLHNKGVDFSDLEHIALRLLRDDGIADIYRSRFRHILFDEYQDCNEIQEGIIQSICKGAEYFMVGDIKQSIYSFRNADPDLFLRKYNAYSADPDEELAKIELNTNYRSRESVLNAANNVFFRMMTRDFCGMQYNEDSALYAHKDRYPAGGYFEHSPTEIALFYVDSKTASKGEDEEDEEEEEMDDLALSGRIIQKKSQATYIAYRIAELMREGATVKDKDSDGYRPLRYSDIAVLMRSPQTDAPVFKQVMRSCGIPFHVQQKEDVSYAPEISLLINLLYAIENPYNEIALLGVLNSYLFGVTNEELEQLCNWERKQRPCLWDRIPGYIEAFQEAPVSEKLCRFREQLLLWQERERMMPIEDFLDYLLTDTCYESFFASMENGEARRDHIRAFRKSLLEQAAAHPGGLFECVNTLIATEGNELELSGSAPAGSVTLMSVHKSKGLEFPVVFIAVADKEFSKKEIQKDVLIHSKLGIAAKQIDPETRMVQSSFVYEAMKKLLRHRQRMEEQRMLYVAMTRAEEKLYILGKAAKKMWETECRFPDYFGDWAVDLNWIRWILCAVSNSQTPPAPMAGSRDSVVTEVKNCAKESFPARWSITTWSCTAEQEDPSTPPNFVLDCDPEQITTQAAAALLKQSGEQEQEIQEEQEPDMEALLQRLEYQYPYGSAAALPSKMTVTQLRDLFTKQEADGEEQVPIYRYRMENTAPQSHLTAAEAGTLFHFFMQHATVKSPYTRADFDRDKERMLERRLITQRQADALSQSRVQGFFNCEEGKRLAASPYIEREKNISFLMPSEEIYPDNPAKESILVQGVVDCVFEDENGELVIVDYKTDRIPEGEDERFLTEKYRQQLILYGRALERITGTPVAALYLYAASLRKWIKL